MDYRKEEDGMGRANATAGVRWRGARTMRSTRGGGGWGGESGLLTGTSS